MPFNPEAFEQLKQQTKQTAEAIKAETSDDEGLDLTGRLKKAMGLSPEPGARSMFGETELPGEIVRAMVPGTNTEALISAGLSAAGPIARGIGAASSAAVRGVSRVAPNVGEVLKGAAGLPRKALSGLLEAGGELFRPGVMREAGVEAIAGKIGLPEASTVRALGEKASEAAYKEASKVVGKIDPVPFIDDALVEVGKLSNPPPGIKQYLNNMKDKLGGGTTYEHMTKELQQLRSRAEGAFTKGNNAVGKAFYELRAKALDEMDKISPALREANALYRKEEAGKDVIGVLRRGSAGAKMREMFETNPLVAKTFGGQAKEIYDIADKLGSIAGEAPMGVGNRILGAMNNLSELVISDDAARAMLRRVLGGTPATELPGAIFALGRMVKNMTRSQTGRQVGRAGATAIFQDQEEANQ